MEREGGRMPQLVGRDVGPGESEAGWTGGMERGWEVEVWAGNAEKEREETLVSAFLFLLFNRAGCHTQSTPPPFLHPSVPCSS